MNGVSFGMLLFVMTSGFTLILGVMNILNLAQGAFYVLGFYVGFSVMSATDNFFLALVAGAGAAAIVGMLVQHFLLARIPKLHAPQVLLTFGFVLIMEDAFLIFWPREPLLMDKPAFLAGSFPFGDMTYPYYRLAIIVMGCLIAVGLWLFLEKTKWGAILRAGRDNPDMAEGIGINIPLVWVMVFGLGIFMAGLAGVLGGPFLVVAPGVHWQVLLLTMVIVIIGGQGSVKGAFVMSILVGLIDNFGKGFFPEFAMFLLFFLLVIVLAVRPYGLFGRAV